jgi:predicted permease
MVPMLTGSNWSNGVSVQGLTARPGDDSGSLYNEVGPGYFRSMGISLLAGREFTASDVVGAPKVAIVNEQFAKEFHLGPDAVGKRMKPGGDHLAEKDLDVQIVGLVRNTKYSDVKQKMPALFYLPHRQNEGIGTMTFYVRGAMEPENLLSIVRPVVALLDGNLPVENLRTMEATIRDNLVADRVTSILSAAFASLATVLAAVGLYGVLAYTVAQRTREFGLRMALGATPDILRRMVFRQVGLMTVIGGVVGLAAAIGLGELAQSLLFEIKGWDSTVLGVSAILLVLVAFGAGFVPANRASNVDPMKALRYE